MDTFVTASNTRNRVGAITHARDCSILDVFRSCRSRRENPQETVVAAFCRQGESSRQEEIDPLRISPGRQNDTRSGGVRRVRPALHHHP